MERHKIYLAGKVKPDWRSPLVAGYTEAAYQVHSNLHNETKYPSRFPVLSKAILGAHDYVGAYAVPNYGEGETHSLGKHGGDIDHKKITWLCRDAISRSTLVFAYIDSVDCYGTLWELGYAHASGKPIFIAGTDYTNGGDLWFVYAQATFIYADDIATGLQIAIDTNDKRKAWKLRDRLENQGKQSGI